MERDFKECICEKEPCHYRKETLTDNTNEPTLNLISCGLASPSLSSFKSLFFIQTQRSVEQILIVLMDGFVCDAQQYSD